MFLATHSPSTTPLRNILDLLDMIPGFAADLKVSRLLHTHAPDGSRPLDEFCASESAV